MSSYYKGLVHFKEGAYRSYNDELVKYFANKGHCNPHSIVIMLQRIFYLACEFEEASKLVSHHRHGDNWFYHTVEQLQQYVHLGRSAQDRIRKILVDERLIEYQSFGQPQKLHYRVNMERFAEVLGLPGIFKENCTNSYGLNELKRMERANQNVDSTQIGHIYRSKDNIVNMREAPDGANTHIENSSFSSKNENLQVAENSQSPETQHNVNYQEPPPIQEKEPRKKYGDFVQLTDKQYQSLVQEYGKDAVDNYILKINLHCASVKGKGYKCYVATIRKWMLQDKEKNQNNQKAKHVSNRTLAITTKPTATKSTGLIRGKKAQID